MERAELKKQGKDTLIETILKQQEEIEKRKSAMMQMNESIEAARNKLQNLRNLENAEVARKNLAGGILVGLMKNEAFASIDNEECVKEAFDLADRLDAPLKEFYESNKDEESKEGQTEATSD